MVLNHAEARQRAESYYDEKFAEAEGKIDIAASRVVELKAELAAEQEKVAADQVVISDLRARIAELEKGQTPNTPAPEPQPEPQPVAPSVTILSPAPGSTVSTTVYVTAAVAGMDNPVVELLYQNRVVATLAKAGSLYEGSVDASGLPNGSAAFAVRATAGSLAVQATSSVTKSTTTSTPPPSTTTPPVVTTPASSDSRFGQIWPSNTPRPGQVPSVTVDCSWLAIRDAVLAGARHIQVRDGALVGQGAGSTKPGELAGISGLNSAGQHVLITPLNGYGRVVLDTGISFVEVSGISFMGFKAKGKAVLFRNSQKSAWGWSEIDMCRVTANGGKSGSDIEWIEPVSRGLLIAGDDRHRFVTAKDPASTLRNIGIYGGYGSTILKPVGSSAHCDHLQVERQEGGGEISGISVEKHIMWGAHSQTLMFAGIPGVRLKDAVIIGGPHFEHRYGRPDTTAPKQYEPRALNGTAQSLLEGENVFLGSVSPNWTFTGSGKRKTFASDAEAYAWLDSKHSEPTEDELKKSWTF